MKILDGKNIAEQILQELKNKIESELAQNPLLRQPRLDMVLVGDDFASQKYVEYKEKAAQKIGMLGNIIRIDLLSTKDQVLSQIAQLNANKSVTGFMVQLPLPDRTMEEEILESILPSKDVDGLTATNLGRLFQNAKDVAYTAPATAIAVQQLLLHYGFDDTYLQSKNVVVLGASKIVGLPIAGLLINAGATVTVCHKLTQDEVGITREADIVISATGIPKLVKAEWVKEGAIVVDVGLSKDPLTGEVCGDVDFENVAPKCSYISKVYGGVGPMTVASLMLNTYNLWERDSHLTT
jgi:methylenetetrahydrofolate dehydrogenase (NADP+)/methenyltetrahydrofolate cyclohydrolase